MRVIVSYPGNFMDAQQAARAYHERDALAAFVTGMFFDDRSLAMRVSTRLPARLGKLVGRELRRRFVVEVPRHLVVSYPYFEVLRAALARYVENPIYADAVWDSWAHRFDRIVACRHLDGIDVAHAFEYTALRTFEEAERRGIAKVLALPSTDNKEYEEIKAREEVRFPELRSQHSRYFAAHFGRRQERRGADPAKILAVPLAAPPPIAVIRKPANDIERPLSVIWAGSLIIRKGAHYFLEAWRGLAPGKHAYAQMYGYVGLPDNMLQSLPAGLELRGSVPQFELFEAFEKADILVFPTLADGFGMIVAEAFSRGLPVITTEYAGASDLVEHGRNGLIVPAADARALADALRWCLENREPLYRMRFRALETAARWQWPDYRRRLITALTEGLRRVGYALDFGPEKREMNGSTCATNPASAC
jgi:glycosyltransferase involved in cell wall biosynthesis